MSDSERKIELNCMLLGAGIPKTFIIQTTRRHRIADVLHDIATNCHETQNTTLLAKPFSATDSLTNFAQPRKTLDSLRFVPTKTVGDYWPDAIDHRQVHILAYTQDLEFDLESSVREINQEMDQARLAVKANLDQYDSSDLTQPSTWQRIQANPQTAILTGHTLDTAGDPVELYHPAFSAFLQKLHSPDRPDAETNNKFLDYRSNSLWSPLDDINHASMTLDDLGVLIGETFSGIKKSDKAFESAITEEGAACCIAIQSRDGFGPNGEDPLVLAALAYAKYWTSRKVKGVFDTSCCPTLIVVTAGPWVCVFGGIFLAQPVVQRFTDMIQVSHNPSRPDDLGQLVRLFHSISIATQALRSFYLDSNYSRLDPSTRPFPYCTSYLDHDGHKVDFKYIKRLGSGERFSTSRVFLAKTLDSSNPKPIVVKFVEQYNSQAHRLLAEQDLAPQLLYDGTTHSDGQIGSDYYMIVMDFVDGIRFDQLPPKLLSKEVTNSIEMALQILHDADLVFGDLRPLNVMVLRDATGTPTKAQLVNFEWCGKHQEGRYPLRMSRSFEWVPGMNWGGIMDKEHDNEMKKKLFSI